MGAPPVEAITAAQQEGTGALPSKACCFDRSGAVEARDVDRGRSRIVGDYVRRASRKQDDIARPEGERRRAVEQGPARSLQDDVERGSGAFRRAQRPRASNINLERQRRPGPSHLDYIAENIHEVSLRHRLDKETMKHV